MHKLVWMILDVRKQSADNSNEYLLSF